MSECLIVGGGVIGLSLAYELARLEVAVRVVDAGQIGREASWAGAGILPPANSQTALHPIDKLRALSHELHPQWADWLSEESGIDTGFRNCGGLYIARRAGEAASLAGMASLMLEEQIEFNRLDSEQAVSLEPALADLIRRGQLRSAYRLPGESQLRNPDHLRALAVACERRGVMLSENVRIDKFHFTGNRVVAVQAGAEQLHAETICLAGGAWTHALLKQFGVTNGIMPVRGQMVLFRCPQPPFTHVINEGPRYLVPRVDGRVLVGSTEEEVGFRKETTDQGVQELTTLAAEIIPQLSADRVERTWAGLRPGSFDGFPYMGRIPGMDNAFAAAGHFRSGLHLSPATAVVMAQLILGREPQVDLRPFAVGRG